MQNFKLNEQDILTNQDWTFPTNIAYGPGRLKEIGKICNNEQIENPLIVTDSGSTKLPFIKNLQEFLASSNVKSNLFYDKNFYLNEHHINGIGTSLINFFF